MQAMLFNTMDYLIIGMLAFVSFQDFKYRAVSVIVFPVLFIIAVFRGIQLLGWQNLSMLFIFNLAFLFFQWLCLTLYFSVKEKKLTDITKRYIGWGDVLFMLILCLFFSFINFIVFYTFALLTIISTFICYKLFAKNNNKEIPLAGSIALLLLLCLVSNYFLKEIDFYNDSRILNYLPFTRWNS